MHHKILSHTQYTHAGDYFSKIQLLQSKVRNNSSILHVVSDLEISKKFSIIAQDIWICYLPISSFHDLLRLKNSENRIYYIDINRLSDLHFLKQWFEIFQVKKWDSISMEDCIKQLQKLWYDFHEYWKSASYNKKGDIISISDPEDIRIHISFWGDEIEEISLDWWNNLNDISLSSLGPIESIDNKRPTTSLLDYVAQSEIFCVLDTIEFHPKYEVLTSSEYASASFDILKASEWNRKSIDLWILSLHINTLEELKDALWDKNNRLKIYTRHTQMIQEFLKENNFWHIEIIQVKTHLLTSYSYQEKKENYLIICDDIISKIFIKRRVRKKLSADIDLLLKIKNGDYVVHIDHWIWIFKWIIKKTLGAIEREYLELSYLENGKLFVPITEVQRVSKYIWSENPKLTPLSWKIWERKMKKVHEDIREIAENILENFAERKNRKTWKVILDSSKIQVFQEAFPYQYTHDQAQSIEDIQKDMQSEKNMDRLLVWDVWFWKTEIAFQAAYFALLQKKQVVLISPLVVLAHEHYNKAIERLKWFGIKIEVLSRLQSQKHATRVIKGLADGAIHMVIGTHRLLSDKIVYKDLWLMIVDEEHKFWVVDKEKIKNIRNDIDILSLSATPIPRSLNLALSWVRDISLIKTPPIGRKSIETTVIRYNEKVIQEACNNEFKRWWQVFFVHNRVTNIEVIKKQLEALFPKKKVIITHWQLPWDELEDRIMDFKNRKYDILLSTTVIENGIDFSNVNTIFINECQNFWISQIHQLRWRVGRSDTQGYCYLLYRKDHIDGEAAKRIQTIVDYSYIWAGFELAMKDLEIRWGWDILGVKQSWQSKEIWVSLFLKMLEEKIQELKEEKKNTDWKSIKKETIIDTKIDINISANIDDSFFLNETDKLNFYRELEMVKDYNDLEYLKTSLFSGEKEISIPVETENLFTLLELKILTADFKISHIKKLGLNYQIDFHEEADIENLKKFLSLDTQVLFTVVSGSKLRCPTKGFANEKLFLEYLVQLLQGKIWNKKIKLVRKA